MHNISGIQMIGTRRSGSNLLRLMLDHLPEISAPHPPHLLRTFHPLVSGYGDLRQSKNFLALARDMCHWVELNPVPWRQVPLPVEKIMDLSPSWSEFGLFRAIYAHVAQASGAKYWLCKSLYNARLFSGLEGSGEPLKYIWLVRDGRDVAVSMKKVVVGPKHIYHIAHKWKSEQEMSAEIFEKLGGERCLRVNYADLLQWPQEEMSRICAFLGVPFRESAAEQFYLSEESRITAASGAMWANVGKPLNPKNRQKYRKELSREEIEIFEAVAGNQLKALGFELEFPGAKPRDFASDDKEFDYENEQMKAAALQSAPPEDLRRRAPQENFLRTLREKLRLST